MTRYCPYCPKSLPTHARGPECYTCRNLQKSRLAYWSKKAQGKIIGESVASEITRRTT